MKTILFLFITIKLLTDLLVLPPFVGLPHGLTDVRPPEVFPSPPPWG